MMFFSISICPTHLLYRYSRTQLYSFPKEHPALPLSSPPWITSMNTLPRPPSTTNTLSQSRLPSQSAKKLLTGTMTKRITLRCSGSQWVRPSYGFNAVSHLLLVLHPRHKLRYFKNAGWQDDWIKWVEEIVCTEFDLSYGSLDTSCATSRETRLSNPKVRVSNHHPISNFHRLL